MNNLLMKSQPCVSNDSDRINSNDWIGEFKENFDEHFRAEPSIFDRNPTALHDAPFEISGEVNRREGISYVVNSDNAHQVEGIEFMEDSTKGSCKDNHSKSPLLDQNLLGLDSIPFEHIREDDVLSARGGLANNHKGNKVYLCFVEYMKPFYLALEDKRDKTGFSRKIVRFLLSKDVRFLIENDNRRNCWRELSFDEAREKTSQALREKKRRF